MVQKKEIIRYNIKQHTIWHKREGYKQLLLSVFMSKLISFAKQEMRVRPKKGERRGATPAPGRAPRTERADADPVRLREKYKSRIS